MKRSRPGSSKSKFEIQNHALRSAIDPKSILLSFGNPTSLGIVMMSDDINKKAGNIILLSRSDVNK